MKEYLDVIARVSFEAKEATKKMQDFRKNLTNFQKNIGHTMKKSLISVGALALGFYAAMKAGRYFLERISTDSPALAVQLELLNYEFSEIFRVIGDSLAPIMADIVEWVHEFVETFKDGWATMGGDLERFWTEIKPTLETLIGNIGDLFYGLFLSAEAIFPDILKILTNFIGLVANILIGDWGGIWDSMVGIAQGAVPLIQKICKTIWKLLSDLVKGLGDMFKQIWEYLVWVKEEGRGPPPDAEPWEYGPPKEPIDWPPSGGGGGDAGGVPPKASVVTIPITIHPTVSTETDMELLAQKIAEILRSMFEQLNSW